MYDFYFGTSSEIETNKEDYLVFVKRLLPRWVNSIPDSEYLAIHNLIQKSIQADKCPIILETGIGASTLVLLNHAMKHNGVLYSWDNNGSKGAFLRGVITDTLAKHYDANIWNHWKFIPYSSTSDHLGVGVVAELGLESDFCFLDSEHTLNTLVSELKFASKSLREGAIVAIDDANYSAKYMNTAYINMQRAKIGLSPVDDPPDNICAPFYEEAEQFLGENWKVVESLETTYSATYREDIFWSYFSSDRAAMSDKGMEKISSLEHRLAAWRVKGRY